MVLGTITNRDVLAVLSKSIEELCRHAKPAGCLFTDKYGRHDESICPHRVQRPSRNQLKIVWLNTIVRTGWLLSLLSSFSHLVLVHTLGSLSAPLSSSSPPLPPPPPTRLSSATPARHPCSSLLPLCSTSTATAHRPVLPLPTTRGELQKIHPSQEREREGRSNVPGTGGYYAREKGGTARLCRLVERRLRFYSKKHTPSFVYIPIIHRPHTPCRVRQSPVLCKGRSSATRVARMGLRQHSLSKCPVFKHSRPRPARFFASCLPSIPVSSSLLSHTTHTFVLPLPTPTRHRDHYAPWSSLIRSFCSHTLLCSDPFCSLLSFDRQTLHIAIHIPYSSAFPRAFNYSTLI